MRRVADGLLGTAEVVGAEGVVVERPSPDRIRIRTTTALTGFGSGRFSDPVVGVRWSAEHWPADIEFLGYAFTQFALPVTSGRALAFEFHPAPGLRSPRAVLPLIARAGGGVTLLAPIDHPHEQVVAVRDGSLTWGWHGDLAEIEPGFATTLGIYQGRSVSEVLAAWRADLAPIERRPSNPLTTHLSYWTDNGAAYWYRTERGRTIAESVAETVARLRAEAVQVHAVELDSWFYDHETPRPIADVGYPEEVPPTGAIRWSARVDAFPPGPGDPIEEFRRRVDAPLVLHARHISPLSPYVVDREGWWLDVAAHPVDPAFFRRWFGDAARWGAVCIEQDWMLMYWFGVPALREAPGRAAEWQRALDEHAADTGVDLMWCMSTPADLILAAHLERVVAVRTSDDYRFADDPAFLWTWFLTVNRLANTLGLAAFKDCFFSDPDVGEGDDPIDGDRHAELEAALSALSGGPVGVGDRLGRTNREIVLRTCDDDGRLRRVDRAIAAIDDCLFGAPARGERLMWATTTATTPAGEWTYVLAINTADEPILITDRYGLDGRRRAYDWRSGRSTTTESLEVELASRDWALWVVSPAGATSAEEVGDAGKYVVVEAAPPDDHR